MYSETTATIAEDREQASNGEPDDHALSAVESSIGRLVPDLEISLDLPAKFFTFAIELLTGLAWNLSVSFEL